MSVRRQKYPAEFKNQIRLLYKRGQYGYTRLAKKFGLTRDAIRGIILSKPCQGETDIVKDKKDKPEFKSDKEKLKYYETAAAYWETYAKLIEKEISETQKKKLQLKPSADTAKKMEE